MLTPHKGDSTMRTLRRSYDIAIILGILTLLIVPSVVAQYYCEPASSIDNVLKDRQPASDGKIHVTFSFNDPNISQTSKNAILNALNQWNGQGSTSGFVFEAAAAGVTGDVEFMPSTNQTETGGCAAYKPSSQRILYSHDWEQRATIEADGATVIAHEIGHYLGLDDAGTNPSTPTIMNNPVVTQTSTCENATVTTTTVQQNDASRANTCITNARPTPTPTPPECVNDSDCASVAFHK